MAALSLVGQMLLLLSRLRFLLLNRLWLSLTLLCRLPLLLLLLSTSRRNSTRRQCHVFYTITNPASFSFTTRNTVGKEYVGAQHHDDDADGKVPRGFFHEIRALAGAHDLVADVAEAAVQSAPFGVLNQDNDCQQNAGYNEENQKEGIHPFVT